MKDLETRVQNLRNRVSKAIGEGSPVMGDFTCMMLHSATAAHIHHFSTRSYATHVALNEYYEAIPGLVDELVEAYQGKYGIVTGYPTTYTMPQGEPVQLLTELKMYVSAMRGSLPQDTELQNIVDEMAALISSTLYKLTFLS